MSDEHEDCINCKYNSHDRDKLPCVLCYDSSNWKYRGAPEIDVNQGNSRGIEQLKQERDDARDMSRVKNKMCVDLALQLRDSREENRRLRKILREGSVDIQTDGEQYQEIEVSFSDTLREIANDYHNEWGDFLFEKAREIDEALGNKG